jgi:formiminotetrahydrofolate cyclodeaminase
VLFLLRPRQTSMPYALPRDPQQQAVRNEQHQKAYAETRRLPASQPSAAPDLVTQLKDLAAMRDAGTITDDEFATLKARLLDDSR